MAKKVVRGVMIIQKNADARTHPRPPAWTRRFRRADREQEIHSLLLFRLPIAIAELWNAENLGIDGEEMAIARKSAIARNASTYHDALMR